VADMDVSVGCEQFCVLSAYRTLATRQISG